MVSARYGHNSTHDGRHDDGGRERTTRQGAARYPGRIRPAGAPSARSRRWRALSPSGRPAWADRPSLRRRQRERDLRALYHGARVRSSTRRVACSPPTRSTSRFRCCAGSGGRHDDRAHHPQARRGQSSRATRYGAARRSSRGRRPVAELSIDATQNDDGGATTPLRAAR